ncbi:MAG: multidrug efflux system membrane fusion protein, partial [Paracoccaceae bacterium]
MRFLRQSLLGMFLAAVTLALVLYAVQIVGSAVQTRLSDEKRPPPAREREFAVNVLRATPERLNPVLQAFGQVQSRRTLELRTPTGGRVIILSDHFEEGGVVKIGDMLVQIDPANVQAALDRVKSDLLDAKAEGRDAQRALLLASDELVAAEDQAELRRHAFDRQVDLKNRGVGTAAQVEVAELAGAASRQAVLSRRLSVATAEGRIDQAATRLARAEIALEGAERDLAETRLTASFDGTLSEVSLAEGHLVSANEKLALLIDPDDLEVAFRISTAQYARILDADGALVPAPVTVSLDVTGADLVAVGRISRDGAATGPGLSGRLIFARLDSAPGFKPGDFVTVLVEEPALNNVVRLSASALDANRMVLVVGDDNRLETLQVELLRRQGDDVLVRGIGLEGRDVVQGRTPLLGAGIRVRVLQNEGNDTPVDTPAEPEMLDLSDERRAKLVAFVDNNKRMPAEAKARVLSQLQ